MIGIFIISSLPGLKPPDLGFDPQDKLYHFIFFSPFGFFVAGSFYHQEKYSVVRQKYIVYAILFGILYAASDEIHQNFVPGRVMSFWDFVADSLGLTAGIFIFKFRREIGRFFGKLWNQVKYRRSVR